MHLIWPMLTPVRLLKVEGIDLFGERVPPSPTSRHHHIKITQKAMERDKGFGRKNGRDVWTCGIKRAGLLHYCYV